jgi:hypothetical protein
MASFDQDAVSAGGNGGFGFGGGSGFGAFGLVGLVGLLNGRNGLGGGGSDDGGGGALGHIAILQKLGDIQNEIASDECATQAAIAAGVSSLKDNIQNQSLGLLAQLSSLQLSGQQAFANTKDIVQAGIAINSQQLCNLSSAMQEGFCSIKGVVTSEAGLTRALINQLNTENLQRELSDTKNELIEIRHEGRSRAFARETEINVNQTVNQVQAQQQQQAQFNNLANCFHSLANELQIQRQVAGNKTVQFGTGNVAVPTNANTANQVG